MTQEFPLLGTYLKEMKSHCCKKSCVTIYMVDVLTYSKPGNSSGASARKGICKLDKVEMMIQ